MKVGEWSKHKVTYIDPDSGKRVRHCGRYPNFKSAKRAADIIEEKYPNSKPWIAVDIDPFIR